MESKLLGVDAFFSPGMHSISFRFILVNGWWNWCQHQLRWESGKISWVASIDNSNGNGNSSRWCLFRLKCESSEMKLYNGATGVVGQCLSHRIDKTVRFSVVRMTKCDGANAFEVDSICNNSSNSVLMVSRATSCVVYNSCTVQQHR